MSRFICLIVLCAIAIFVFAVSDTSVKMYEVQSMNRGSPTGDKVYLSIIRTGLFAQHEYFFLSRGKQFPKHGDALNISAPSTRFEIATSFSGDVVIMPLVNNELGVFGVAVDPLVNPLKFGKNSSILFFDYVPQIPDILQFSANPSYTRISLFSVETAGASTETWVRRILRLRDWPSYLIERL